ncbi:DUF6122 family protein [Sphingobacterium suaedae]|uniref:DUF6122 family protein n=1 Tax=Sphingobacterium suaedae TaxID=1686402 RepID=A0ABW5KBY3_9SPHI
MEQLKLVQTGIHYGLHFLAPGAIAYFFFRPYWKRAWTIFLMTMLVDLDHLAANPVFDPDRCSIGFHILHSYIAIGLYAIVFLLAKRGTAWHLISLGLLFHMLTDFMDCQLGSIFR